MYSVFYKRPNGECVRINSEFQPQTKQVYDGMIYCSIDDYTIIVPFENFCLEYHCEKSNNNYERQMEELLHGK